MSLLFLLDWASSAKTHWNQFSRHMSTQPGEMPHRLLKWLKVYITVSGGSIFLRHSTTFEGVKVKKHKRVVLKNVVCLLLFRQTLINQRKLSTVLSVWTCTDVYSIPLCFTVQVLLHPSAVSFRLSGMRGSSILSCQKLNLATVNNSYLVQCSLMS